MVSLQRTFWSTSYGTGAVLGIGFVGCVLAVAASLGWTLFTAVPLALALVFVAGVRFATGRARVRVVVGDGRARFERWLHPVLDVELASTSFAVTLADNIELMPGPVLVRNERWSARIRDAIQMFRYFQSDTVMTSKRTPDEYFAVVAVQSPDSEPQRVLLPGVSNLGEIADVLKALGIDEPEAPPRPEENPAPPT